MSGLTRARGSKVHVTNNGDGAAGLSTDAEGDMVVVVNNHGARLQHQRPASSGDLAAGLFPPQVVKLALPVVLIAAGAYTAFSVLTNISALHAVGGGVIAAGAWMYLSGGKRG